MDDYYELLGVSQSASAEDIKKAYRRLARELHPDVNKEPGAEDRFKRLSTAYETLSDPERRRRYDMFGPEGAAGGRGDAGGAGFGSDPFTANLGDLFESFFGGNPFGGGGRGRGGPPRGGDIEVTLRLSFSEAVFGGEREVKAKVPVTCDSCDGSGAEPGTSPTSCSTCSGTGQVRQVRQSILGQMVTAGPCPRCGGAGQEIRTPCNTCRGEGRRTVDRTYTITVPGGVDGSHVLRRRGMGAAGSRGGPAGDLLVHFKVSPDDRFTREGNDLVHVMHVPFTQAALGTALKFDTLDGEEDLVIPKGTQTGREFRLRGRGVPHLDGRGRGDLRVRVVVDTPTDLTKEQDNLVRLLAAERGEEVAPADSGFMAKIRSAFK